MVKTKKIIIQERKSNHFEVRIKTEITKDYTIALITVVNVSEWIETPSLKTQTEEKEIYRRGFEDIQKASETYETVVFIVKSLSSFLSAYPEMLQDWITR